MVSIKRAFPANFQAIVDIGSISVKQAHLGSCPEEDLDEYMRLHYNQEAIQKELEEVNNVYHLLYFEEKPSGFTKLVLNSERTEVVDKNIAKMDRIYLLPEYFDKKLGKELIDFNVEYARQQNQAGLWLVTWVGNSRAINFYKKAGFEVIGSYNFQVTPTTSNLNHLMFLKIESA